MILRSTTYPTTLQDLRPPGQHSLGPRLANPHAVLSRSGDPFHLGCIRTAR